MSSFAEECTDKAMVLLAEAHTAADSFAARSGIKCREGCGECCLKPRIEVQVIEMLPAARALLDSGEASAWYDRAAASATGRCVFYAPEASDETRGRCTQYALRPSVCRLFGFAAVTTKDSTHSALASCHWHKKLMPDTVKAAQLAIDRGAEVPLMTDYSLRLQMLAPTPSYSERLPLNQALMMAIEKLSLAASIDH